MDLPFWVSAADPAHIAKIRLVHADQQVVCAIVGPGQLPGRLASAGNSVLSQLPPGRRIDWVPDFLSAGSRRCDLELRRQPSFFHQVLHDELGHWAPANIAVTYKENSFHWFDSSLWIFSLSIAETGMFVDSG